MPVDAAFTAKPVSRRREHGAADAVIDEA